MVIKTVFLSILAISVIGYATLKPVFAATESGDINVSATIPTPPPQDAPTIDQPSTETTFNRNNITVSGRCTAGLTVKIFSNDIFVGSTICSSAGDYSLQIDLFMARNDLVARQYDTLNQSSPSSNTVVVYYSPPVQPSIPDSPTTSGQQSQTPAVAHFQLIIDYDYTVQSIFAGQAFRLPVKFMGGTGPYTVTIDWGEGSSNTFKRNNTNGFDASFIYERPGTYIVSIKVNDSAGQEAYLQFVLIVHGEPEPNTVAQIAGREIDVDLTVLIATVGVFFIVLAYIAGRHVSKNRKKDIDN